MNRLFAPRSGDHRDVRAVIAAWRAAVAAWWLRRRRARVAKRRGGSRRMTYAIAGVLVGLLAGYFAGLAYVSPSPSGQKLTFTQLSELAAERRVATAVFRDEDNQLVGRFVAVPLPPRAVDEMKNPAATPSASPQARSSKPKRGGAAPAAPTPAPGGHTAPGTPTDAGETPTPSPAAPSAEPGTVAAPAAHHSTAPAGSGEYYIAYPKSSAAFGTLAELLTAGGAEVEIDPQSDKAFVRVVTYYLLPLLILAAFFGLLFTAGRGSSGGIGEVLNFGTIGKKGHRRKKGAPGAVTFADVGSADEAVSELREVVDYLTNPAKYDEIGAVPPKGVLLFGPPGCGKTLLAKAVAGEAGVPFFSVAGAEFVESLVGVGAARVRDLFARVRAVAPAIVFIDELDAAGRRRSAGGGEGGTDEREQTLNQLLVEMDGFEVSSGIVVMGATNRPDILDPALMRPGRFDRHITIEQPDAAGRADILALHARGKFVAPEVDLTYIAKRTPGFSGADLASVMNEAALLTLREGVEAVTTRHLEEAIQRVLHGPKRRGHVLAADERRRIAVHEAGHAVAAAAVGHAERLHRVTILAQGKTIGAVALGTAESRVSTRDELYAQLLVKLAGVAAEEMLLGSPSTGSEDDLEAATQLARELAGRYGFSERLGRARLLDTEVNEYLGGSAGLGPMSPETHAAFDREVRRLLDAAESQARRLLRTQRVAFESFATRLGDEETLEGDRLDAALAAVAPVAVTFPPNGAPAPDVETVVANGEKPYPRRSRRVAAAK